uniref:Uncharacterized protein n=1 Tax=Candidatus Kentrum sp. FM TaxID=2126340 RepID=A0A450S7I4_9GAMM|nr:MAG: hypothetical protein BECKFM1743A_GA0114220_100479 [Candidatus Kentron sp. FM]VFJ47862.1 MAG: hypothetical protein BECKFM1743C_GA0114222_1005112 [Candidatus Kentron sp. FM]VFK07849.1 MAG: hypothetical protein BECKFM1743B_GA0114221_100529 [Candidatus Kentron sp. FM]
MGSNRVLKTHGRFYNVLVVRSDRPWCALWLLLPALGMGALIGRFFRWAIDAITDVILHDYFSALL